MGKSTGPSCKVCRREGMKLFFKSQRCVSEKCAFGRRSFAPGQHGKARVKLSDYGLQLREKQKVKKVYGVLERQFRLYFQRATRIKGVTGHILLSMLERRLDNVVFRLRMSPTRQQARQMVCHGRVCVNGKKVDIPSYQVGLNARINLKLDEAGIKKVRECLEASKDQSIPPWLNLNETDLTGSVVKLPQRDDIQLPIKEQLIVELYSK
ncbi:MAG: 30S ribosomal protein S4 [Candidatus Omnitrophica bacterium CG12_big_fil_rev_8_21_14_0_65_43_15]|uniref:Small ribosomal subunit protein uS4 n=1 Tax=Candidatus Taenaricola geysiri TaxID=1974752 RepID=A0A2J0LMB2_9BACT|nr:MAG: 30S ribosomal protein S4 [Candidatus Omnitrophica bacterium CG1_02_43_210]PIR65872.1 MAG: 30S ribosomal protein S4 [Candidatus Omnitrophica bacterium CG10_big_fil_rev_8_21_14_0_10_43_8]PIV12110.1 MAG: 30S ribosomal protein S4 [Candidatus Omnitrophica bacterium CG03_land_8_20_14_0_80_43_22]PIW66733.1 MAG: 30S ribosomal protein S4 [Candidatus Omnitrophica bacterium CG12_big_fil_rev_8_21_14_0_65_43_15]PIW79760.1 MAG: 30S ribosomal protein S4 [Candidatus Omnitrophica bacterium CG_4_8_14_3_u